jgi:hypothetical protein
MANAADRALAREKSLSAFRLSKSMHATLAFARRLMADGYFSRDYSFVRRLSKTHD